MQVYAPVDSNDLAFHRVLYLFVCRSVTCLRKLPGGQGATKVPITTSTLICYLIYVLRSIFSVD